MSDIQNSATWKISRVDLDLMSGDDPLPPMIEVIELRPVLVLLGKIVRDDALGGRYPGHSLVLQAAALVDQYMLCECDRPIPDRHGFCETCGLRKYR